MTGHQTFFLLFSDKQDVWSPVPLRQYKESSSKKSNEDVPFHEAEMNALGGLQSAAAFRGEEIR